MSKVPLSLRGEEVLKNPLYNKGTAFTEEERDELGLHGLLPYHEATIDEQLERRYKIFQEQPTQIAKYIYLSMLQNRNETLFFKLVHEHIDEMLPLIYTPTVGEASVNYSSIFAQTRGIYFSYPLKDKIDAIINNIHDDVDVIVVTDGERILGLGDLGAGGMAISVGKLALYSLFGGIHPARVLPVVLDVGTNNKQLLNDKLYIGWRHHRITGDDYHAFVDLFIQKIKAKWPKILLQWEDFGKTHARSLLDRHVDSICSFNDDIQGTASVVLAAIYSAVKSTGTDIKEQKIVVFGGGSAGMGICQQIHYAMVQEGLSPEKAYRNFYVVDINGLITNKSQHLDATQIPFARPKDEVEKWKVNVTSRIELLEVIENIKPTILIGVSTVSGAFNEDVIKQMSKHVTRPVIFPLSNPTSKSEALPIDLLNHSDGRAIIATGSPFAPVEFEGESYPIAQCNNVYIFPGVGLGVIASKATKVTDQMFLVAAKTLSDHSPMLKDAKKSLFPPFSDLREISREIAIAVGKQAQNEGVAPKISSKELAEAVDASIWVPEYATYSAE